MTALTEVAHLDDRGEQLFAGRYRLQRVLGRGGAAVVHQAVDERLQRPVALKVFRPDGSPDLATRFGAEARLLARMHHRGLVEIYDYGHTEAGPYLVLELLTGPTLRELLLLHGPLPMLEVAQLGRELANTLAHVHSMGIIHRDIKPSNVLLDRDGVPRLTDFGVSRLIDEAGATRTGTVIGTAAYLAPEQVRGQATGPAADVYALALLLIECLTGRREYPGPPAEAAIARLQRPPTVPQGLPPTLARLLHRMTATEPEHRPSADRCAELLGRTDQPAPAPVPAQPVASTTAMPSQRTSPGTRRRRGHRSLLAVAALLAGAGLAWDTIAATADPAPRPADSGTTAAAHRTPATPAPVGAAPKATAAPRSPISTIPAAHQATTTPVLAAAVAPSASPEPNEPDRQQPVKRLNDGIAHGPGHR